VAYDKVKGTVHPKNLIFVIFYSPSCCSKPVGYEFLSSVEEYILKNADSNQFTAPIDPLSIFFFLLWRSMGAVEAYSSHYMVLKCLGELCSSHCTTWFLWNQEFSSCWVVYTTWL